MGKKQTFCLELSGGVLLGHHDPLYSESAFAAPRRGVVPFLADLVGGFFPAQKQILQMGCTSSIYHTVPLVQIRTIELNSLSISIFRQRSRKHRRRTD